MGDEPFLRTTGLNVVIDGPNIKLVEAVICLMFRSWLIESQLGHQPF
jgi:hypothetical protein